LQNFSQRSRHFSYNPQLIEYPHPNEKWVTDITYIQYGPDTLYLSTIMDLYNNQIVTYKLYPHQQTSLVMDTLDEALEKQGNPKGIIIHSDQGSVYAS
jgi:putative transposase